MTALKTAPWRICLKSDKVALCRRYKDYALVGKWHGYRAFHVDSAPNLARDQWMLMYRLSNSKLVFVRTGTHEEMYGK